jgi:hypothetical protein
MQLIDANAVHNAPPNTQMVDKPAVMQQSPIRMINAITLFKNGPGSHLDLMLARILHRQAPKPD